MAELDSLAADEAGMGGNPLLGRLCRWLAIAGGALLLAVTVIVVVSVVGRYLFASPIRGDAELVGMLTAMAVSLFLPYCQLKGGNVIVDVFTVGAPAVARRALDLLGGLLLAGVAGVLAWQMSVGGMDLLTRHDETMVLRLPTWIAFVAIVPSFALLSVVSLVTAYRALTAGGEGR